MRAACCIAKSLLECNDVSVAQMSLETGQVAVETQGVDDWQNILLEDLLPEQIIQTVSPV